MSSGGEGYGEYIEIIQSNGMSINTIRVEPEEWPAFRGVIDHMIQHARQEVA